MPQSPRCCFSNSDLLMNDFYDQAFRHNQPIPSLRTYGTARPEGQKASLRKPFPIPRRKELHDAILDLSLPLFQRVNKGLFFSFMRCSSSVCWEHRGIPHSFFIIYTKDSVLQSFFLFCTKKRTPERRVFVRQYWVRPKKPKLLWAFLCADGRLLHILLIYFIYKRVR